MMEIAEHCGGVFTVGYNSFGTYRVGRIITITPQGDTVVYSRNPYGSHNLVLVTEDGNAFRHGNLPVLIHLLKWSSTRAYRRVRKFLWKRGRCCDLHLSLYGEIL